MINSDQQLGTTTIDWDSLYDKGYAVVRQAVPDRLIQNGLREINMDLAEGREANYRSESESITDMLHRTHLWQVAEAALGIGSIANVGGGQVALRFPEAKGRWISYPHLDMIGPPASSRSVRDIKTFNLLVGIFLSPVTEPYQGNLSVWPRSHHALEGFFRENGSESATRGMPSVPFEDPVQITAEAGDAILAHYQLAHAITGNQGPRIRYAVFFRLHVHNHSSNASLVDIWKEWRGEALTDRTRRPFRT